ncbi:rRNA maturation RNase YbeY [Gulbenkiania mobilis]|uniref:Endoribonuclease YbeY n=1 Tax=Gulbenkiania mobilis TaxID=397457 RepID=A0ABY2CU63_GULMO|nr:putative rRNA maturation factor [Gulbenkiania mobilis]
MKIAKRNNPLRRLAGRLSLAFENRSASANPPPAEAFARWARAALQPDVARAEVSLLVVDADEGRALNHDYRGKDYPTNVLSFALNEGEPVPGLPLFGDLVFCAPVVEEEARTQGKTLEAHYAHLTVHGLLHLQGFDHEGDDEAEVMEKLESVILAKLGYANPYAEELV